VENTDETRRAIPRCDNKDVLGTIIAKLNLYPMILTFATLRARHYRERLDKSSTYRRIKTSASSRIAKKLAVVEIDKEASGRAVCKENIKFCNTFCFICHFCRFLKKISNAFPMIVVSLTS